MQYADAIAALAAVPAKPVGITYEVEVMVAPSTPGTRPLDMWVASFTDVAEACIFADAQERATGEMHTVGKYRNGKLIDGVNVMWHLRKAKRARV